MNDEEIIKFVKRQLSEWAFEDIKRASNGGSKMGAFILASCLIDYLACFRFNKESSGKIYKKYCQIYMPAYNSEDLYVAFRCKLVHNYTEGGKYAFTDNKPMLHLALQQNGQILLNLENFLIDIEDGMHKFFEEIEDDKMLKERMVKRYKKVGLLGLVNI